MAAADYICVHSIFPTRLKEKKLKKKKKELRLAAVDAEPL
jgi:thiamine monophosphate synthase